MSDNFVQVYPFDPTGKAASNLVVGEQQILTETNGADYHLLVPKFAPFFAESLVLNIKTPNSETRKLTEGVDYLCSHWFIAASRSVAAPVYGSISIVDTTLAGVVTLGYQTLGGIWSLTGDDIAVILSDKIHNPRITAWDEVLNKPITFPVIDHEWDITDLRGAGDLVESINRIEQAVSSRQNTALNAHISDYRNPHNLSANDIGCYTREEVDSLLIRNNATIRTEYMLAIQDAFKKYLLKTG